MRKRYTDGQYPILIKGTEGHYVPWQTLDLAGLVGRLPDIHEDANKWIRAFEEETVGKMLALGDIKAIWAQCCGAPAMENILKTNNNEWMLSHRADGTEFNAYRPILWRVLRDKYPTRVDPKVLQGEPLSETDTCFGNSPSSAITSGQCLSTTTRHAASR